MRQARYRCLPADILALFNVPLHWRSRIGIQPACLRTTKLRPITRQERQTREDRENKNMLQNGFGKTVHKASVTGGFLQSRLQREFPVRNRADFPYFPIVA